jgi:hypothetical protein
MKVGSNWPIINSDLANKNTTFFSKVREHYKFLNFVNLKLNKTLLEVENLH